MTSKVLVALISALLAASFVIAYGLTAMGELEAISGLSVQTTALIIGARSFLFIGAAFVSAITVFGVKKLLRNR